LDTVNLRECKILLQNYINFRLHKNKSHKICTFEIYIFRSTSFLFLYSSQYKVFKHDSLHVCGINNWLHPNIFRLHKNKSHKICTFEIYIFRSTSLLFLYSSQYKVFKHDSLHVCGINNWLHPNI
jgi:hypothetical protein